MKNKNRRWLLQLSLVILVFVAVTCFMLAIRLFMNPDTTPSAFYNLGVDVLGVFVCLVLFSGCINESNSEVEESIHWFIMLILLTDISFFVNALEWCVSGIPAYRTVNLLLNSFTKILDFGLVFFFYSYVRNTMEFEGAFAEIMDDNCKVMTIPATVLIIINFFTGICFTVTPEGIFEKAPLYWLVDLYLVFVAPGTIALLFQSKNTMKQKLAAFSFIAIPIIHYIVSGGAHGYATQYGSTLVATLLMYTILFSSHSKKLAATQIELQTATGIQEAVLPHIFPPFPDRPEFDLYASMDPAREVGGDFYDFFLIDDEHLCLIIADVSGKGIPGALFMMISKVLLQNYSMMNMKPAEILTKTNEALCTNNKVEMFVTVWLGILEIRTGKLTAANAGHEYPAFMKDGKFSLMKDKHGLVIGGMPGIKYKEYDVQLNPGDKLFVYTDGVAEAMDRNEALFGTDRMLEALNNSPESSCREIIDNVSKAIEDYVDGAEQFDDITMLCMEYKGPQK